MAIPAPTGAPPPPVRRSILSSSGGATSLVPPLPPRPYSSANNSPLSLVNSSSSNSITQPTYLDIPLIAFINGKSGGKQGANLIKEFQKILPKEQVFDILDGGPMQGLTKFQHVPNLRIVACGGDGTGRWVLETLDKIKKDAGPNFRQPPVGVIPLGTGNDIGRVIGWGGGYNNERLEPILDDLMKASEVPLDRWIVEIHEEGGRSFSGSPDSDGPNFAVMNNYLCLGFADAKIALNFHRRREQNPELFFNRNINKLWYVNYGVREIFKDTVSAEYLCNYMTIEVDGRPVIIPSETEGIVILNLPSYAGGMNLWGPRREDGYSTVSMCDGKLEVIGLRSVFHLGQIGAGLTESGIRIAQGSNITLTFKANSPPMPGKIDGEPWLQSNSAIFTIRHFTQSRMLCKLNSPGCLVDAQMSGWLYKRRGLAKRWQLRWVVIYRNFLYIYYTRTDQQFRVRLDLQDTTIMKTEHMRASDCFEVRVTSTNKAYSFSCHDTGEILCNWINCLLAGGASRAHK